MGKGNVLVLGNSGVGKSTLINAVLGENVAKTSYGTQGTTKELSIYENEDVSFRLIDTVGFEPSFVKERQAINAVKKWSRERAEAGNDDNAVNVIWFCVEGTASKLFPTAINDLSKATSMWKSVPVIAVITKSYSIPDRAENIKMVEDAFSEHKRYNGNLPDIIPVVAQTYELNETAFAPPEGIDELIELTNAKLPEGIKAGESDLQKFKLMRNRALAHGLVSSITAGGAAVGAVELPGGIADAAILTPVETAMIHGLAKIYGIPEDPEYDAFLEGIIGAGAAAAVAKGIISIIKLIPGLQIAGALLNAIVAGGIIASLGEVAIYAFEQVYLGKKTLGEIDWLKKLEEKIGSDEFSKKIEIIAEEIQKAGKIDKQTVISIVLKVLFTKTDTQSDSDNETGN